MAVVKISYPAVLPVIIFALLGERSESSLHFTLPALLHTSGKMLAAWQIIVSHYLAAMLAGITPCSLYQRLALETSFGILRPLSLDAEY